MKKNFRVGWAAAVGCLMVLAGWTGAAAQEQGCDWVQAFCPGISWDNVEKSVSGVIMYQATNGQAPQDRCLFIGGAKGDMNFQTTTSGHLVNGAAPTNSFFNAATFNAQAKKDGGYYVFLKSSTQVWAQFDVNQATQGTPTLCSSNYTITFNPNGGTVATPSGTTGADGKLASLPTPTRTGFTFAGWFTAATNGDSVALSKVYTANTTIYAHWKETTFTITFNANGGTVATPSGTTGADGKLASLPTPTRTGFTFAGWFTAATNGDSVALSKVYTANTTIYAHWTAATPSTFTITFNVNGSGGSVDPPSAITGTDGKLASLPTPTRANYTFAGWFTAATNGDSVALSKVYTANTTIYAHWTAATPSTFTITFNANGGTVATPSGTTGTDGKLASLPTPTRDNYTFAGWFTAATNGDSVALSKVYTANTTIYAHWTAAAPTTYTITFDARGGTVSPTSAETRADGTLADLPEPTPSSSVLSFVGWFTATVGGTRVTTSYKFTAPTTIFAQWQTIQAASFKITFDANGGSVSPSTLNTEGDTLSSLPTPTRTGYKHVGWFTTAAATGGTEVTIHYKFTADATIYARWSVASFKITFNPNGGTVSPGSGDTDEDGFLTSLPTPTLSGYNFDGWFTAASGGTEVTRSTKFDADATIYAHWTEIPSNSFTITFNANGGTVSPGTGVTDEDGYLLTDLPEPERTGYRFDGWFTAATGGTEVRQSQKFSGNTTIYAHWTAAPAIFTITFNAGGGEVSPGNAKTGEDSTLASLPMPTRSGYSFEGWYTAASGGGEKVTASYKFSASITVYALWTAASSNIAEIDTVLFVDNSAKFSFTVIYHLTEDKSGHTLRYDVLDSASADVLFGSEEDLVIKPSKEGGKDTLTIPIGSPLFDTTYLIHIYTVDANGLPGEKKSEKSVKSGSFVHQILSIPFGDIGSVNNGNFKLAAVGTGWYNMSGPSVNMTVKAADAPSESDIDRSGFIPISSYGYKYTVTNSAGDMFLFGAFKISMRANSEIPKPYEQKDVKLYRWNPSGGGYWEVVFDTNFEDGYFTGTAVDSVGGDTDKSYRLMINTLGGKPTVTSSGYSSDVVEANTSISASYTVTSNVGNCKIKVLSGPAKGWAGITDNITEEAFDTEKGLSRKISFSINDRVVSESENCGVLAFIVVDDGSDEHAENVSYRVKSAKYRGFPAEPVPKKWLPFASQIVLDNKSVKPALQKFFQESDSFAIYDTLFRLFRWHETRDNRTDKNKWVEYNGRNDSSFNMETGQLMWLKTSAASVLSELDFGGGTSAPIRTPFEITLPSKQWTDIVLPFSFNICLGDILDATEGANSLEIYRWRPPTGKNQKYSYVTEALLAAADTTKLDGGDEPFTVYNSGNSAVKLLIPPLPSYLSRHDAAKKKAAGSLSKAAASGSARLGGGDAWYYTVSAAADGSELSNVYVGYSAAERVFAVPPSFGSESVVLVGDDGEEIGHHFGPSIASGRTYKLRFYNDGGRRATFTFSAKQSAGAPVSSRVTFVKASTGELLGGGSEQSITVAGMSHEDVFMVVGGGGYRAKAASVNAGAKFAIDRVTVNRSARSARVSYYVPESGVNMVEASIYDIRGRQVWKTTQKVNAAAWNVIEWNSRGSKRSASTGLYVLRVRAVGAGGRTVGADTRRIMFSR